MKQFGRLAWLDLDSEAGAGVLGGDEPDGRLRRGQPRRDPPPGVASCWGPRSLPAWRTTTISPGRKCTAASEVVVHRKGATPAGRGVLGVIPGSMADPAFVVRGRGSAESLNSASHGAGRRMSRTAGQGKSTPGGRCKSRSGAARRTRPVGRGRRSARRVQEHRRGDARAARPGRGRGPLRSQDRQDVRRRQQGRGLSVLDPGRPAALRWIGRGRLLFADRIEFEDDAPPAVLGLSDDDVEHFAGHAVGRERRCRLVWRILGQLFEIIVCRADRLGKRHAKRAV